MCFQFRFGVGDVKRKPLKKYRFFHKDIVIKQNKLSDVIYIILFNLSFVRLISGLSLASRGQLVKHNLTEILERLKLSCSNIQREANFTCDPLTGFCPGSAESPTVTGGGGGMSGSFYIPPSTPSQSRDVLS